MTNRDILFQRLYNQQIAETKFKTAQEIVSYMVAMQAQVWEMAKWAIGLRLPGSVNTDIENAFNRGDILRTHVMRPTWHFVTPNDIHWLLALTAPRVNAFNATYYKKMELDEKVFKKTNKVLIKILQGKKQLDRNEIKEAFTKNKIQTNDLRFMLLLMQAELAGLICSGARKGKQFTYALLDELVPMHKPFMREEALAELVKRYFITRGPATIQDFVWWSGLTVRDAKEGLAINKSLFQYEKLNGIEYIFKPVSIDDKGKIQSTFILPDYDEYGISYKDRSIISDPKNKTSDETRSIHNVIIDGVVGGVWEKNSKKKNQLDVTIFKPLSVKKQRSLSKAITRYSVFSGQS
jgi:hypothetical protein